MPSGIEERCPGCHRRKRDWPLGLSACKEYWHVAIPSATGTPYERLYWLKRRPAARTYFDVTETENRSIMNTCHRTGIVIYSCF